MGCDMHVYLEYRKIPVDPHYSGWNSVFPRINPGRSYNLFANLAGVRGSGPSPKGMPTDAAYYANMDNSLHVTDSPSDLENCVRRITADKWVTYGSSTYNHNKTRVSHPDWHNHSWETGEDWIKKTNGCGDIYDALNAAIKSLMKNNEVRVIYWFDN